jgi:capsid portal protein
MQHNAAQCSKTQYNAVELNSRTCLNAAKCSRTLQQYTANCRIDINANTQKTKHKEQSDQETKHTDAQKGTHKVQII